VNSDALRAKVEEKLRASWAMVGRDRDRARGSGGTQQQPNQQQPQQQHQSQQQVPHPPIPQQQQLLLLPPQPPAIGSVTLKEFAEEERRVLRLAQRDCAENERFSLGQVRDMTCGVDVDVE
jgi:hypothetical protein